MKKQILPRLTLLSVLAWTFCSAAHVKAAPVNVAILNPTNGSTFQAHAFFNLRATAWGTTNGSIAGVEFWQGTTFLTNFTSGPYLLRVGDLGAGNFNFSARAFDHAGRRATNSITVHIVADTSRPVLSIVSPVLNQRISNDVAQVEVRGKARDNVRVSDVQVQLNNGAWVTASTTNGFTNWTASVTPQGGTNRIRAYATDPSTRKSLTNSVSFFYVVPKTLLLITNGLGGITRSFEGLELEVGRSYTVTAVPDEGQIFAGWDGSIVSTELVLHFVMAEGLNLDAHFVANPFPQAAGEYNGLFGESVRSHEHSGAVTLNVATDGTYTAKLQRGTNIFSFSGKFNAAGYSSKTVNGWFVYLVLDLAGGEQITGTVSTGAFNASLTAKRPIFNASTNPATQYRGKYTLIIPGANDATKSPGGDGFGTVTVNLGGQVAASGNLGDGRFWSEHVGVARDGVWPCYVPMYGGQGSIWCWMVFSTNIPSQQIGGTLSWIKPALSGATYYADGFTNEVVVLGSRYTGTNFAHRVIGVTNGVMVFDGGDLGAPFTNVVTLTVNNKIVNHSANSLAMSLVVSNGTFTGQVVIPGTTQTNSFKGAVLQDRDAGFGYFLGADQSGSVFFGLP